MNVLTLPLRTHLSFIPALRSDRPCVFCLGPKPDFACERCAAMMHGDCYFSELGTDSEKIDIQVVNQEEFPTGDIFLCQGCRS